jgi:hypothetical protein
MTQAPPAPASAAPPAFTELEQAKLQAVAWEGAAIDADQRTLDLRKAQWQAKVSALKAALEATRDGWDWEAATGTWTRKPAKTKDVR